MSRFWDTPLFHKSAPEWPQMPLTCWRSNITKICMIHTPWKPAFSSDSLYYEPFRVMSHFCEKCTKNPPKMTMPCSRLKVHPHTPLRPKFSSFCSTMSRYGVTSQFCEKCTTRLQNDLDIPKVKSTHMHTTHTHPRPKFHYIRSTMSYGPILVKVHRMTPRWPWHVQGQWYLDVQEIHPRDPIFVRLAN